MFPARLSPHLAGVWKCKAKSLLIRVIGENRGSNCRFQVQPLRGWFPFPREPGVCFATPYPVESLRDRGKSPRGFIGIDPEKDSNDDMRDRHSEE
jgi:hypothetical protein